MTFIETHHDETPLLPRDVTETIVRLIRDEMLDPQPLPSAKLYFVLQVLGCSAMHHVPRGPEIMVWLARLTEQTVDLACQEYTSAGFDVEARQRALEVGVMLWRLAKLEVERQDGAPNRHSDRCEE